jgi:hypothetical protein
MDMDVDVDVEMGRQSYWPLVCYRHGRTAVTDGCRKKRPTSGVETKESDESVSRTTSLVFTEETVTPAG